MFASDRDLLAREPVLFEDVSWAAQRLVVGTGTVSGTTLTMTAGPSLTAQGVAAGMVALVTQSDGARQGVEIVEVTSSTAATVSLVRARSDDAVIPPTAVVGAAVSIVTLSPQIELVHRQVLQMAGIEGDGRAGTDVLAESAITNGAALVQVEALGALAMVLGSLAASSPDGGGLARRAAHFRTAYEVARRRAIVEVDLDGDGLPDAARRLNGLVLERL